MKSYVQSMELIVNQPCYREIGWLNEKMAVEHYAWSCREVSKLWVRDSDSTAEQDKENVQKMQRILISSLKTDGAALAAELIITMKSHKPQGKVLHRNIHAASKYAFAGLSCWLNATISKELEIKAPWILPSREVFVERV